MLNLLKPFSFLLLLSVSACACAAESGIQVRASIDAGNHPKIILVNKTGKEISFESFSLTWQDSFTTDVAGIFVMSPPPAGNATITVTIPNGGEHTFFDDAHTINRGSSNAENFRIGFKYGERVYWSNEIALSKL